MKPSLKTFAKVPNIIRETCLQDADRFPYCHDEKRCAKANIKMYTLFNNKL